MSGRGPVVRDMPRAELRRLQEELAGATDARATLRARIESLWEEVRVLDARITEIRDRGVTPDASGDLTEEETATLRRLREAETAAAGSSRRRQLGPEARALDAELLRLVEDGVGQIVLSKVLGLDRTTMSRRVARARARHNTQSDVA